MPKRGLYILKRWPVGITGHVYTITYYYIVLRANQIVYRSIRFWLGPRDIYRR